ncbi:MAG: DUF72 domain-containing protein [Actinomycetota bacterium]
MTLYVGTSGWAYDEWRPDFYPPGLPYARFLEHYATSLGACEINSTFYRRQSEAAVKRWKSSTPTSFRFTAKVHRLITHATKMASWDERRDFMNAFMSSLSPLGRRLGAVLLQCPAHQSRAAATLERILALVAPGTRFAIEFTHASWDDPGVRREVAGAGGTVCLSDAGGPIPEALPPGPLAYVRLRRDRYTPVEREEWRALLARAAEERHVFAFAKHKSIPAADPFGGVGLARWLAGTRVRAGRGRLDR